MRFPAYGQDINRTRLNIISPSTQSPRAARQAPRKIVSECTRLVDDGLDDGVGQGLHYRSLDVCAANGYGYLA